MWKLRLFKMEDIYSLLGDIDGFLDKVLTALADDGIDVSDSEMDHICYRVETQERYEAVKDELSELGELLSEAVINGRPIATFKLAEPIVYKDREIYCVEVPSPKKNYKYPEGLEHAEFVIGESFGYFIATHPKVKFDAKDIAKANNPDIKIEYKGFSVKFHRESLEEVIKHEKEQGITE